jgi:chaperonin GroEL (HSP60 family)
MKKFSLFEEFNTNLETISDIDNCIKITLGPTGKMELLPIKSNFFLSPVVLYLKSLDFPTSAGNVILKLLEQAANKTFTISGDGSTTTILLSCQLLLTSLRFFGQWLQCYFL